MAIGFGTPVEYFSVTEQSPHTLTLPTYSPGDVIVISMNHSPNGTATIGTITIPTGWTEVSTNTNTGAASNSKLTVIRRVMQSGDGTTLAVSTSTNMTLGAVLQTYTNVDNTTPEDATAPTMNTGTGNPVCPSITTVTNGAVLLSFCIIDAVPSGFGDTSIPSGMTLVGTMANNPPSNGMNLGMARETRATAGSTGTRTWSNGASEEHVGATMALRPQVGPTITSVDTDNDVDDEQDPVLVAGSAFGATDTGSADVEIGDNAVYATANKISQTRNSWSATSISIVVDLGTQSPGTKWMWVTDSAGTRGPAFEITVHRAQAWVMSLGAGTPGATTARLTAPSGKTTADFDAGRFEEAANPATAVDITEDDYTEMVWSIEAKSASREVSYRFRVTKSGTVLDTYTVNPQAIVSAAQAFTLNAEAGSYAITGAAATVPAARAINAAAGSYSITGALAALLAGRSINAEPGSYSITGAAASLLRDLVLNAEAGAYAITGALASLLAGRSLNAEPGSYSITGVDAALNRGFALNAEPGSYAVSGAAATLLADRVINAEAGSYSIVGVLAAVLAGRSINAEPGSYSITGVDANLARGFFLNAEAGAYGVTGAAAVLLADRMVNAEPGSYLVSGQAASLLRALMIDAVAGSYAITGADADLTLLGALTLNAEPGSYSITGADAALIRDLILNAEAGSYAITGADASLDRGFALNAESGLYSITGADASLLRDASLNAEPGSYSITGADAALLMARLLEAGPGVYAVTGAEVTALRALILGADPASYVITGAPADLTFSAPGAFELNAEPGSYVISGAPATLLAERQLNAAAGAYVIVGADGTLEFTGVPVSTTGGFMGRSFLQ